MGLRLIVTPFGLQFINDSAAITFKSGVANAAALPLTGNSENDARITNDTHHLYVWNGTSWIDQGDILDVSWSSIIDRPSSLVSDIDDAVSKKHSNTLDHSNSLDHIQGTDTYSATQISNTPAGNIAAINVQTAINELDTEKADKLVSINPQVGITYQLALSDNNKLITLTNASPIAVTIPTNLVIPFAIGTQINLIQNGLGKVTFSGAGVTIKSKANNKSIAGQNVAVSLIKEDTDVWYLIGDLVA